MDAAADRGEPKRHGVRGSRGRSADRWSSDCGAASFGYEKAETVHNGRGIRRVPDTQRAATSLPRTL